MAARFQRRNVESESPRTIALVPSQPVPWWTVAAHYPSTYGLYVLVCFLDLIVTNTIIAHFGGQEANALAAHAIHVAGFWGLIAFKVASMVVVLLICQYIGHRQRTTGHRVAVLAVALSAFPVIYGIGQIHHHPVELNPAVRSQLVAWMD